MDPMQQDQALDVSEHVLRPTPQEVRETHILFHAKYATATGPDMVERHGYQVIYHTAILALLRENGFRVTPESRTEAILEDREYDFLYFISSYAKSGKFFDGRDTLCPAIAAFRGIPHIGPPAPVRAVAENKVMGRHLAKSLGIEVAAHYDLDPLTPGFADFALPGRWVLKPRGASYSAGLSLVENEAGWPAALTMAADPRFEGCLFMAEEFVPGLNLTVPVIDGLPPRSLEVFEERGRDGDNIITEASKIGRNSNYASRVYTGPARERAQDAVEKLAAALGPIDYGRFDFRYDPESDRLVFLETNLICALGPAAIVTLAAKHRGIDHKTLVGHIVTHSLRRQRMEL